MAKRKKTQSAVAVGDLSKIGQPKLPIEHKLSSKIEQVKWALFLQDDNNRYPNDLAKRIRRSSTHKAIIDSKVVYTIGDGFEIVNMDGEVVDFTDKQKEALTEINAKGESLRDIYKNIVRDYISFGNCMYNTIRSGTVTNIEHRDLTTGRRGKNDRKIYISRDWDEIGSNRPTGRQEVISINEYRTGSRTREQILWAKEYNPEFFYYGLPDYQPALLWIDIEYRIPKYNLDKFDNGFLPSAILSIFGDPPDGTTPQQYVDEIKNGFTGEGKTSKLVVQLLDSADQASKIEILDNIREGDFQQLQDLAVQNIITAHRWHPSLSGIQTAGKLGDTQEIRNAYEIAINTVIKGYQDATLKPLNKILRDIGFFANGDEVLTVKRRSPISLASDLEPKRILTINEQRQVFGKSPMDEAGDILLTTEQINKK